MSVKPNDIKTAADLTAAIMAWGTQHQVALNGLVDKMPEPLKQEWITLKSGLNDLLAKLKPTDQVPAALDAGFALNSFARTICELTEYADRMRERIGGIMDDAGKKAVALQSLEKRITDGDLLAKDKVTPLIDTAKTEATNETMKLVVGLRKSQIALAGLPEADATTLAMSVADFDAAFAQAKSNVDALSKKGMTLQGKGKSWVEELAWKAATAFQGSMTRIDELLGIPATRTGSDPLLGAGNGNGPTPTQAAENKTPALTLA